MSAIVALLPPILMTAPPAAKPLDQLTGKRIHIRATGGRRASPMTSALKMHARRKLRHASYASRANVQVPELNVNFVLVSPLIVVHV